MKAIAANQYGGPEVLMIQDLPEVEMTPRDVKVKVHAASLNPVDWKIREGHLKQAYALQFPWIAGQDMAGVVTEVGMRARNLKVGDRVYARVNHLKMGTLCETVTVEKTDVAKMPESLSFEEAASLPLVALTAWQVLVEIMNVKGGDSVFIQSGSGGVGTFSERGVSTHGWRWGAGGWRGAGWSGAIAHLTRARAILRPPAEEGSTREW